MASVGRVIRGLAGRNNIIMNSSARTAMRVGSRSNMVAEALVRVIPKRGNIRQCIRNSSTKVSSQQQTAQACARSKSPPLTVLQQLRSRLFHTSRARRSQNPSPTSNSSSPPNENLTLGQRMRKLSREYGWSALGVYFALTAFDFPFCYLFVRYLGTERIGEWEHVIVSNIQRLIPASIKSTWHEWRVSVKQAEKEMTGQETVSDHVEMAGWGVEEAQEKNKRDASLATQLALAYAIHKSFIFIRVPLTVALTPKVVKVLRGWGWDIGKRTTKEARAINRGSKP